MEKQLNVKGGPTIAWIPLSRSLYLLFHRKALFGWATLLVLAMVLLTWLGYLLTVAFLTESVAPLFGEAPPTLTILDRIWHAAWTVGRWLSLLVLKVVAFYLNFLFAYTCVLRAMPCSVPPPNASLPAITAPMPR
jgi:CysZ protein